jgi:hypothetical protein
MRPFPKFPYHNVVCFFCFASHVSFACLLVALRCWCGATEDKNLASVW